MQAKSLRDLIEEKVAKEGLVGVAIVGGIAVAAGILGGLLMRKRR
jgi:mitochondrial fission 1 protein